LNYLAHLYLAGNDTGKIVGNFIADAVKGDDYLDFEPHIRSGILMHRQIDSFTDSHPIVKESIRRLRPKYHKFSGIIVDMFYDHFLAANWNDYSDEELLTFTNHRFALLIDHFHLLPPRIQRMLPHMIRDNWLMAYASLNGLDQALTGISHRTSFVSRMEDAVEDLKINYISFENEFREFFPAIQKFVSENGFELY
jgi:acyl carrier protein phosphodiesterase